MSELAATATRVEPVESRIAGDMVRRALPLAPVLVLVAGAVWGVNGALSAAYGLGLVLLNFLLSAALLGGAAKRSPKLLAVAALGGYLVRMALIVVAVLAVDDFGWVHRAALGITIVVTHVGLLIWEVRFVSGSLAFPDLKPRRGVD